MSEGNLAGYFKTAAAGTHSSTETAQKRALIQDEAENSGIFTVWSKNRCIKRLTIWNLSVKILPRTAMKRPSNRRALREENPRYGGRGRETAGEYPSEPASERRRTDRTSRRARGRPLQRRNEAVFARGRRIRGGTAKLFALCPLGAEGFFCFWKRAGAVIQEVREIEYDKCVFCTPCRAEF